MASWAGARSTACDPQWPGVPRDDCTPSLMRGWRVARTTFPDTPMRLDPSGNSWVPWRSFLHPYVTGNRTTHPGTIPARCREYLRIPGFPMAPEVALNSELTEVSPRPAMCRNDKLASFPANRRLRMRRLDVESGHGVLAIPLVRKASELHEGRGARRLGRRPSRRRVQVQPCSGSCEFRSGLSLAAALRSIAVYARPDPSWLSTKRLMVCCPSASMSVNSMRQRKPLPSCSRGETMRA